MSSWFLNNIEIVGVAISVLGSFGAAVITLIQLRKTQKINTQMKINVSNSITLRDIIVKNAILSLVPEEKYESTYKLIEEAFQNADKEWRHDYLPQIYGRNATKDFMNVIEKSQDYRPINHKS